MTKLVEFLVKERRNKLLARKKHVHSLLKKILEMLEEGDEKKVYVFGSWVWGHPHKNSDLDIAVDDRQMEARESIAFLKKVLPDGYEEDIDVLYLTEASGTLRNRILAEGFTLKQAIEKLEKELEREEV